MASRMAINTDVPLDASHLCLPELENSVSSTLLFNRPLSPITQSLFENFVPNCLTFSQSTIDVICWISNAAADSCLIKKSTKHLLKNLKIIAKFSYCTAMEGWFSTISQPDPSDKTICEFDDILLDLILNVEGDWSPRYNDDSSDEDWVSHYMANHQGDGHNKDNEEENKDEEDENWD